jgi:probable HAF family extracellular repeat protein
VGVYNNGGAERAFLYAGALFDLGTLRGNSSAAAAINDQGALVGRADNGDNTARAFVYSGGLMRDLGTLGGLYGQAAGINNSGAIVGGASSADSGKASCRVPSCLPGAA